MACEGFDPACWFGEGAEEVVSKASNDALQELTNRTLEGFGKAVASLGTMWVSVPTPVLTAGDGAAVSQTNQPGSEEFSTILGYMMWIGIAVAALSLIILGALITVRMRRGDGIRSLGSVGVVLGAVILMSSASGIVGAVLTVRPPDGSASAVAFLQNSLWYYVGGLAVLSVIVAGIRMAWEQRAQPGKELLQSLITLVVVSGAGLTVIGLAVTASDAFSVWILEGATDCNVSDSGDSACFGRNVAAIIALSPSSPVGLMPVLILGVIALLMTFVQVAFMIVRGGLLVVLAGVLPLTASFTNTQMGRQWFGRIIGWTLAFILYKPAAAIIYAAAFQLVGSDAFADDGQGLWSIVTGMALMLIAVIALPAMLRFVAPMTSAVAGGGSAGMAMAGAAGAAGGELATGAIRRFNGSSGGGGSSSGGGASSGGGGATSAPSGASSGAATTGKSSATGAPGGGAAAGGGAAGGGAAAAAGGGAAAGGAAAAGPAAPIVLGAQVAGDVAKGAANAAKGAVESATNDSTGPTGS
jgi:hypothetical protein